MHPVLFMHLEPLPLLWRLVIWLAYYNCVPMVTQVGEEFCECWWVLLHCHQSGILRKCMLRWNRCIGWGSSARLFSCRSAAAHALPAADVQVDWSSSLTGIERGYQWQQDSPESRRILEGRVLLERQRLARQDIRAQVVEEELNLVFDQLPDWFDSRQFDWTGNTNYTAMNREVRAEAPSITNSLGFSPHIPFCTIISSLPRSLMST